jgi:hypothetical protein
VKIAAFLVCATAVIAVPAALAWPGRPTARPPEPPGAVHPPAAWIESTTASAWLAYGSYCWKTACIDMLPPQTRPDLPVFAVKRGGVVRVHLAFAPSSFTVSVDKRAVVAVFDKARSIVSWKARRGGFLTVFTRMGGDASYVARLSLR